MYFFSWITFSTVLNNSSDIDGKINHWLHIKSICTRSANYILMHPYMFSLPFWNFFCLFLNSQSGNYLNNLEEEGIVKYKIYCLLLLGSKYFSFSLFLLKKIICQDSNMVQNQKSLVYYISNPLSEFSYCTSKLPYFLN